MYTLMFYTEVATLLLTLLVANCLFDNKFDSALRLFMLSAWFKLVACLAPVLRVCFVGCPRQAQLPCDASQ